VVAAFTIIEVRRAHWLMDPGANRSTSLALVLILMPLSWWTLIGRAIHNEALAGDRQFWITRPYSWRSLLAAKALFILAFINLPMLAADIMILRAFGFSLGTELPGLLWSQILLTIVFLLPVFALSTLTTGFTQLMVAILSPCVFVLVFDTVSPRVFFGVSFTAKYEWFRDYFAFLIIASAGLVIVFWQYARRGTGFARSLAFAAGIVSALVIMLIPWTAAFGIQSSLSKERVDLSSAHMVVDLNNKDLTRTFRVGEDSIEVRLGLQIVGLPSGLTPRLEHLSESFQEPDGSTWKTNGYSHGNIDTPDNEFEVQASPEGASYKKIKDEPLMVRGSLYLTLYGDRRTTIVPIGIRAVPVPQVGVCSATENVNQLGYSVICNSAFDYPAGLASFHFLRAPSDPNKELWMSPQRRSSFYSSFPADLGIVPVMQDFVFYNVHAPADQSAIDTMEPLAHIRLDFEINNMRLSDYELHRSQLSH
jgi:hypothetical protein